MLVMLIHVFSGLSLLDAREYAGFIFGVLDVDMAGSVTFDQFLVTMSLLTRGTPEEKIRWLFKLYDLDGDGFITPNELLKILLSLYHMLGRSTVPHSDRATIQNHANRVFQVGLPKRTRCPKWAS